MRTIAHISDIHFGKADPHLVRELVVAVRHAAPDVVAVSGDLTQRARPAEFEQARDFLSRLPTPQIVVPGNHDVPLHNVFARFRRSLDTYREYISPILEPHYSDAEIAVLGLNTARSLTIKGGRVNERQISLVETTFEHLPRHLIKILVTHHPFDLPSTYRRRHLVTRASRAMERFAALHVDLLLAGHIHRTHSGHTAERYLLGGYAAIFVQAGTAASTRGRGEPNAFNVIRIDKHRIEVDTIGVRRSTFRTIETACFERNANGWAPVDASLMP